MAGIEGTSPLLDSRSVAATHERSREAGMLNCWLHMSRHHWGSEFRLGNHLWRDCLTCNRRRMTAHVSCHVACWGGPG